MALRLQMAAAHVSNSSSEDVLIRGLLPFVILADPLRDPQSHQLPPYEPLRYELKSEALQRRDLPWAEWRAVLTLSTGNESSPDPSDFNTLVVPFDLTKIAEVPCSSWPASGYHGHAAALSTRCVAYLAARGLCVRLRTDSSGRWIVAPGSPGCRPPATSPVDYRRVDLDRYQPRTSVLLEGPFAVTLRSSDDPWVVAADLTDGTFNFGVTTEQHRGVLELFLVAAVACFIVGASIFACLVKECGYYDPGEDRRPMLPLDALTLAHDALAGMTAANPFALDPDSFSEDEPARTQKKKKKRVQMALGDPEEAPTSPSEGVPGAENPDSPEAPEGVRRPFPAVRPASTIGL